MKRQVLAVTCGLALLVGASSPLMAQAKTLSTVAAYRTPVSVLKAYLGLMNSGKLPGAYKMYADIAQHISFQSWKALGNPYSKTKPTLRQAHVVQKDGLATIYSVIHEQRPIAHMKPDQIILFSFIKQKGNWKMVFNDDNFGKQKYKVFQQLDQEQQRYALTQIKK